MKVFEMSIMETVLPDDVSILSLDYFTSFQGGVQSIVMSLFVYLSAHITRKSNFYA